MAKYENMMRPFMSLTKALADETRVRMLLALRGGELCVCQITELFGLAPSTVSKHLSILFQAGLVESRKAERWVYYRLPDGKAPSPARAAIQWVTQSIGRDARVTADAKQLKAILKLDPVELCKRQCPK
jgi:DNA-binding transcriptional ArsR family regulator